MTKRRLVLIDGHSNIFKAYHAIKQSLTNSRGEPTSAVYGFVNMFRRLYRDMDFKHVAVVFDPPGKTFRSEMYTEYKANRPPMPDDLRAQEIRIREWLEIMKIPVIEVPGYEADDVLADLAIRAAEDGEALICSSDKDLLQVVRPGIKIWREHLQKTELLDEQGVVEKMGVRPDQIPEYLGLVGDSSDNIPGVPGIGKKTAAKLLSEYGSIAGILEAVPSLKKVSKALQNLVDNEESAKLSTQLATLKIPCVEGFQWDDWEWTFEPNEELRTFYRVMEFRQLLEELPGKTVEERTVDYRTITTQEELQNAVDACRAAGRAAIDTETDERDPDQIDVLTSRLVGISISWKTDQAVYIPIGKPLSLSTLSEILGPALNDSSIEWIAHHWNFDYKVLKLAGLKPRRLGGDTMIASYLINPERTGGSLKLKELALTHLGVQMTEISELIGKGDDMVTMSSVSLEEVSRYACQDADMTLQLHEHLLETLREANMEELYRTVEMPLIEVLAEMELAGVRIDRMYFRELSVKAERDLERMTDDIHQAAGRPFNINSTKQLAELLFEELQLPPQKKGKSGAYSTDITVLEALREMHPLPAKMVDYRAVEKLKNTYIDPLPGMIHPKTGRVHTHFNQTVAATGRLSSSNPNLQNIPVRTEAGRAIRQGFIPSEGWKFLSADYSQIELRILAHLSQDKSLCEAFRSGGDIHTLTAAKVFALQPEKVTSTQRSQAKAINFGIIYGMTEFRLANDLGISRAQAKEFIQEYFRVYSGVHEFIEKTKDEARKNRFVSTIRGRRRFLPDIDSRNFNSRSFAERIAVNTPIQGSNADMIKIAMRRIADRLEDDGFQAKMILQVHDELIFDTPPEETERLSKMVVEEMRSAIDLSVPIAVGVAIGDNWSDCKD